MKKLTPLLSLLPLVNALPPPLSIPDTLERIELQKRQGAGGTLQLAQGADSSSGGEDEVSTDVETHHINQPLDHFSRDDEEKSSNTFKQRYFYTSRYVRPTEEDADETDERTEEEEKKVLAFLCVGGEGPSLDESVLVDSVHCTGDMIGLADKLFHEHDYDVHLFALGKFCFWSLLVDRSHDGLQ